MSDISTNLPTQPQPDFQQSKIIQAIQENKNIAVNAVFGSGKTTTILRAVQTLPDKHMILVTYNTHLKNEVQEKVDKEQIKNLQVHTYHSLCMKYFGYGKNDEELQQMDEISVISRQKSISNTGLNRDELLERNTKIMGKKSKRIVKILTQQVSEKMADENYLRGLLDANLISMEEFLKITMPENGK
jgi:superfamily II DNA or RNA helicase